MQGDITRILLLVTQTFENIGIPYAVGGSLASSLHGIMRATLDVDIVADMRLEHVEPLVAEISQEFYADAGMMRGAIEHHGSFNLVHYDTAFKVDVFIPKTRPFDGLQLERSRFLVIATDPERGIYVASPEDIILAKLEWFRLGGEMSDQQWRDILGVLKTRPSEIALDYLHQWAGELGVSDLLERALLEADVS